MMVDRRRLYEAWRPPWAWQSDDEHGISEGEETILLLDGLVIGLPHEIVPRESSNQHHERASRHVEVGNESLGNVELVRRVDEFVGPTDVGLQVVGRGKAGLDGPHHCCSDRSHGVHGRLERHVSPLSHLGRNVIEFAVHAMLGQILDLYRAKRPQPGMQRHWKNIHSLLFQGGDELRGEVQTGGRSRDSTALRSKHRLISIFVFRLDIPLQIRRDGRLPDFVDLVVEFFVGTLKDKPDCPTPRGCIVDNLSNETIFEIQLVANADLAGRVYDHVPQAALRVQFTQQEHLDARAGLLLVAKETGGEDFRVVHDHHVAFAEVFSNIGEHFVLNGSGSPIEDHESRRITGLGGIFGNEILWVVVFELGKLHAALQGLVLGEGEGGIFADWISPKSDLKDTCTSSPFQTPPEAEQPGNGEYPCGTIPTGAGRSTLEHCVRPVYYIPPMRSHLYHITLLAICLMGLLVGCDAGLEPPEDEGTGTITGSISYVSPWPPAAEVHDLRFIAMRFVPRDTTDFFRLSEMAISERLPTGGAGHAFTLEAAPAGTYFYAGVAQKYADDLLAWRPVGLVETDGGVFTLPRGGSVHVEVTVDFSNPPVFPPQ